MIIENLGQIIISGLLLVIGFSALYLIFYTNNRMKKK